MRSNSTHWLALALTLPWLSASTLTFAQESGLEEVIVTAQKREQNIQEIPVSITAFSPRELRDLGINAARDLARYTPGLVMNANANGENDSIFTLRGIGMNDVQSNQNPAITPYVDEVPLASHVMVGFHVFDMERIEVLKGPQGTLYGRNTTGGALRFISRKPTREFSATGMLSYSDYDRTEYEFAAGGPLNDSLSGRVAVGGVYQKRGWQTLDVRGLRELGPGVDSNNGAVDRKGIRGSLLWQPSDALEALIVADYTTDDSESMAFEHAGNLRTDGSGLCSFALTGQRDESQCASFGQVREVPAGTPTDPDLEVYSDTDNDPRTVGSNFGLGNKIDGESTGLSAVISWDLGRYTMTSVTGYRSMERTMGQDQGGNPFFQNDIEYLEDIDSLTQELRLSSGDGGGPLTWVAGVFYSTDDHYANFNTDFRDHPTFNTAAFQGWQQDTDSVALFSQVEWAVASRWTVIGGLRYTDEERKFTYSGSRVGQFTPAPIAFFSDEIRSSEFSGKLGVDFHYNDDVLLYANASRGFKGGGFPASIAFEANQLLPFASETIYAYEAGFKSTLADGQVRFNSAVYYNDWRNFQARTNVDREGIRLNILTNAGDAEIYGIESEFLWSASGALTFKLGFNWMDAKIVKGQFEGDRPAHAPELMFSGYARYDSQASIGRFKPFVQADVSWQDEVQFILPNHPAGTEDAYAIVGARLGVRSEDGHWEIAGFARNLFDEVYRTEVFGPGSAFLPGRIFYGAPRTVGISISYSP